MVQDLQILKKHFPQLNLSFQLYNTNQYELGLYTESLHIHIQTVQLRLFINI